jgi:hypothetical protein
MTLKDDTEPLALFHKLPHSAFMAMASLRRSLRLIEIAEQTKELMSVPPLLIGCGGSEGEGKDLAERLLDMQAQAIAQLEHNEEVCKRLQALVTETASMAGYQVLSNEAHLRAACHSAQEGPGEQWVRLLEKVKGLLEEKIEREG